MNEEILRRLIEQQQSYQPQETFATGLLSSTPIYPQIQLPSSEDKLNAIAQQGAQGLAMGQQAMAGQQQQDAQLAAAAMKSAQQQQAQQDAQNQQMLMQLATMFMGADD